MSTSTIEIALAPPAVRLSSGQPDTNLNAVKAQMGARIVRILDEAGLSIRQAEVRTGISHLELSRIRQGKLRRLTLDRLMAILEGLGQQVEVSVTVQARRQADGTQMDVD